MVVRGDITKVNRDKEKKVDDAMHTSSWRGVVQAKEAEGTTNAKALRF